MTAPTQAPENIFDSEEFYELMQAYQHARPADFAATVANFEAVKDFCKLHAPQPTQAQPVAEVVLIGLDDGERQRFCVCLITNGLLKSLREQSSTPPRSQSSRLSG